MNHRYTKIINQIYQNATASVRMHQSMGKFKIERGIRQGDTMSPKLFCATLEYIFKTLDREKTGINIDGEHLHHLRFADDIVIILDDIGDAAKRVKELQLATNKAGIEINFGKMTNLVLGGKILIGEEALEQVRKYKSLVMKSE